MRIRSWIVASMPLMLIGSHFGEPTISKCLGWTGVGWCQAPVPPTVPSSQEAKTSPKDGKKRTLTPEEDFVQFLNESTQASFKVTGALEKAQTNEEKKTLQRQKDELRAERNRRLLEFAKKYRKVPADLNYKNHDWRGAGVGRFPVSWIASVDYISDADPRRDRQGLDEAVQIIFEDYGEDRKIAGALSHPDFVSAAKRRPDYENRLQAILAHNSDERARGWACYQLADRLKWLRDSVVKNQNGDQILRDAQKMFQRVIDEYGDVDGVTMDGVGRVTLGWLARQELGRLQRFELMKIGTPAPETESQDIDGKVMKLSDFRGKVVVISFWGFWCSPCRKLIPQEQALVKRMAGKPFALLGVNSDENRDDLKKRIVKSDITWRSWWENEPHGPIATKWHVEDFPTVYVLDGKGVIRYRWVTGKALDDAVDTLVKELERK